ncbi:MAG TPA: hypothetical protein VK013_14195 [Myxococcaceae bacterium]|nr:hypothetical protein [Myxococcaceae bacterium]
MSEAPLPPQPEPSEAEVRESLREAREARIAALEARARRPRGLGVHPAMGLMGMLVCAVLLWQERLDLAYLFAPRTVTTLGAAGSYRFDALASNRYVQVHGRPTSKASFGQVDGQTLVMVGLEGTPFVVRRPPLPGEAWRPGQPPPAPNPSPFAVRGRLLRADEDPAFRQGYAAFEDHPHLRQVDGTLWGIVEGERPGSDRGAAAWGALLVSLLLFNAWLFVRGIQTQLLRRRLASTTA